MTTPHQHQTIDTYDRSATQLAQHFQDYAGGAVRAEIEKAFELAGHPQAARTVEIGCGAGKDAAEIAKRSRFYEGFDPSAGLLNLARAAVPQASFVQADALTYHYPDDLDIVFAFASLLHVDRTDFAAVCQKVAAALRPGGIFCLILKESDSYEVQTQTDEFGIRTFFLYNPRLVQELAGPVFEPVFEQHDVVGIKHKRWFTIMLRRNLLP